MYLSRTPIINVSSFIPHQGKSIITDTGRFMMKLILKLRFEPEERLQERVLGSTTRKFSELLHHYERIAKDERRLSTILEIREELVRYRLKELPDSEEDFVQLGGKVSERLDSHSLDGAVPCTGCNA